MKKLAYFLSLAVIGLASCTSFDSAVTENYGEGPAITIELEAVAPTDSAFNIILTPASNTLYYSVILDQSDEAEELNNYTLLKGGYSGSAVIKYKGGIDTIEVAGLSPNTTYQVYAVAGSDKGIAGKVANASITTTDNLNPSAQSIQRDADNKAVTLGFSEAVARSGGKVTAQYYKEWDILNPVDIPEDQITVTVAGKNVTFAAPKAPNGSIVTFSYEAGAFLDSNGNPCKALKSGLNMTTGRFTNLYVQVPYAEFEIDDSCLVAPADGSLISDWTKFLGVIKFDFDVYRDDDDVETGDVSLMYINNESITMVMLKADEWAVNEDSTLTFTMPKAPQAGDRISVGIREEAITDVFGNPNAEFVPDVTWKYFAMTKDMAVGQFELNIVPKGSETGEYELMDTVTIEFDESDPTVDNALVIKDLFQKGTELTGSYDLNKGVVYIESFQDLGFITIGETTYGTLFYPTDFETELIAFTVNPDGTLTSEDKWGVLACDETYTSAVGWITRADKTQLVPCSAAAMAPMRDGAAKKGYALDYIPSFGKVLRK